VARLTSLLLLSVLVSASDIKLPAPPYSGRFPRGYSGLAVLDTSGIPYFLADSGDRTVAYALQSGRFVRKYDIPRLGTSFTIDDSLRPCGFNLTGDVDGDGIDEFVVATKRTVKKYKMLDRTLALTAVASINTAPGSDRMWITDGHIGDVNNDGRNEVLIAATGSRPPACGGVSASPVELFVCLWDKDDLIQLWNDSGALKLEQPSFDVPAEIMWAVADPRNTGTNRLILLEGRGDDVHPAVFREVVWRDGRLVDEGIFLLQHGRLQRDDSDWDAYNSATGCRFGQTKGKTVVIADIFDGDRGVEELFVFSGDSVTQHLVLWPGAWTASLIDPDGKGVGILRILNPNEDESGFEFYRL
jgi:hypothetical protein